MAAVPCKTFVCGVSSFMYSEHSNFLLHHPVFTFVRRDDCTTGFVGNIKGAKRNLEEIALYLFYKCLDQYTGAWSEK